MEEIIDNYSQIKGKTLEKNVEYIFKTAGFETYTNQIVAKYEIDVLVKIGDRTIIVECKNYQNSSLTIRNLIHEWNSKNNIIKAQKVILVLAGLQIKPEDYMLAKVYNIDIWDQNHLSELFKLSLDPLDLKKYILNCIDLKEEIDIANLYREEITKLIIFPMFKGEDINIENVYYHLNNWLRIRGRTDLKLIMADVEEINRHIELFENTKKRKVWFMNVKVSEIDYWEQLINRLKNSSILSSDSRVKYLNYMESLQKEFLEQRGFFEVQNHKELLKRLIKSRISILIDSNNYVCLLGANKDDAIKVEYIGELQFKISLKTISEEKANIISWFLTSEYSIEISQVEKYYTWISSNIDETSEKVFRIFNEVIGIDGNKPIYDFVL